MFPLAVMWPFAYIFPADEAVNSKLPPAFIFPLAVMFPAKSILICSLPEVWKEIVSVEGNLIFVFESPVWYIVSEISKLPPTVALSLTIKSSVVVVPLELMFPLAVMCESVEIYPVELMFPPRFGLMCVSVMLPLALIPPLALILPTTVNGDGALNPPIATLPPVKYDTPFPLILFFTALFW